MALSYGISRRGQPTLLYRGFEYCLEKKNSAGKMIWRCCRKYRLNCGARVATLNDQVVSERTPEHNHEGNMSKSLARKAIGEMKNLLKDESISPAMVKDVVLTTVPEHVRAAMPTKTLLNRSLRNERQKMYPKSAKILKLQDSAPSDLGFDILEEFQDIILYDSGPGEERMLIFGSKELLESLSRSDIWIADATFKITSEFLFRFISIHVGIGEDNNPAALYCFLAPKRAEMFEKLLQEVAKLLPEASPKSILVDFEKGVMNAFHMAFSSAVVSGCYFHLCHSVFQKVNKLDLKSHYESNDEIRNFIRCLPALAYVKAENVVEAFDILAEDKPTGLEDEVGEKIDELLTFFEHTYIRGRRQRGQDGYGPPLFSCELWNQYNKGVSGIARTSNAIENWHYGLQSLFSNNNCTLWSVLKGIKSDINKHRLAYYKYVEGKAKYKLSQNYRRLQTLANAKLSSYKHDSDILIFLRNVACVSYV